METIAVCRCNWGEVQTEDLVEEEEGGGFGFGWRGRIGSGVQQKSRAATQRVYVCACVWYMEVRVVVESAAGIDSHLCTVVLYLSKRLINNDVQQTKKLFRQVWNNEDGCNNDNETMRI